MGSYAIVGAHLPIALGAAWSAQYRRSGQVAVCFFGDGTTNIGAFHEALNLAAVWKAPVVFVCENNQYMEYTADRRGDRGRRGRRRTGRRPTASSRSWSTATTSTRSTRSRRTAIERARSGRRAVAHRGAHLPPRRPLPGGSRQVPAGRRGRGVDGPRPDPDATARGSKRPAWTAADAGRDRGRRSRRRSRRPSRRPATAPEPDPARPRDPGLGRRRLGVAELTYRAAIAAGDRPGDGARPDRRAHRRGRRRGRRRVQADRGPVRPVRAASASATRRSASRRSSARRWAPR